MKKVLFLLIMFTFFIEASSCNNSQGEKHNEMKVSIAETKIQTKDSPFDVENGVLKKYHWQKCEETKNEKRKSVYNKKYDLGELGTGEEL